MNALQLLRQEQADNRQRFAQKQKAADEAKQAQQQYAGAYLGKNANNNAGLVLLDGSSSPIECEILSDRLIPAGRRVMVSLPDGASKGFIDAPTT
jgi:membrane protein implicated in regulation of membrane protease activity